MQTLGINLSVFIKFLADLGKLIQFFSANLHLSDQV